MNILRRFSWLYQRILPQSIRMPLWHYRRYLAARLRGEPRPQCRAILAEYMRSRGRTDAKVRLHDGRTMWISLQDMGVGRPIFEHGCYEPAETTFVSNHLQPGMTFIDIGANIGYYTLLASRKVGRSGRVIAFEPEPVNYELLTRNICLIGNPCAILSSNIALGADAGEMTLWKSDTNLGDHRIGSSIASRNGVKVSVIKYDDFAIDNNIGVADLLKIDVQGYEAKVFDGMRHTFRVSPPKVILMEYWPYGVQSSGADPEQLLRTLVDYGYTISILQPDGVVKESDLLEVHKSLPEFNTNHPDSSYVNIVLFHTRSGCRL